MASGRPSETSEYKAKAQRRIDYGLPSFTIDRGKSARPNITWHDIAATNMARFENLPRPRHKTMVVVELEDVIRAATAATIRGLKLDGVGLQDIESLFLFHCRGFGNPTETQALLRAMPFTSVGEIQNLRYGLYALDLLGYDVHLCTDSGRSDWLWEHKIDCGPDDKFSLLLPKAGEISQDEHDRIVAEHLRTHPQSSEHRPVDVPMSEDDIALVELMRKAAHENGIVYLTKLADMISEKSPDRVVYVSSTLSSLRIMGSILTERGIDQYRLVLFGNYPWNKVEVDWGERGAWMTYEQRRGSGEVLGKVVDIKDSRIKGAAGWPEAVRLFDPAAREYLFDAGDEAKPGNQAVAGDEADPGAGANTQLDRSTAGRPRVAGFVQET